MMGKYKIFYPKYNVTQVKDLVSHKEYTELAELVKLKAISPDAIKKKFGDEFFTDESPLGLAMSTGILSLPAHQGGDHECIITKL